MEIADVTTTWLFCPFPSTIANASATLSGRDVLLVSVHTDSQQMRGPRRAASWWCPAGRASGWRSIPPSPGNSR